MITDCITAEKELNLAGTMNPGPWTAHSHYVAMAAKQIAKKCEKLDEEKAYVCGLLHDIGRREGVSAVRHTIDGYNYLMKKGWDEVARISLTHSFSVKDMDADIGKKDITEEQYLFMKKYLQEIEYDDYDKLIILCDSLALPTGFCILEKRFVDTTRRYGAFPFTVDRWNKTIEFKEYFDQLVGTNIYSLLPDIEKCIYE